MTRASSEIGEAIARALAAAGASVAIAARSRDRLEGLAAFVRSAGGRALTIEGDITDPNLAARAVEVTVRELGRLDIVVNTAGVMLLGPLTAENAGGVTSMLDPSLRGLVQCAHSALPHLRTAAESGPRGVADVVNVSTGAGQSAGSGLYDASEFAVGALTESLRAAAGNRHLRVGVVRLAAPAAAIDALRAAEVADAVLYMVTRPRHAAIGEIVVRPTQHEP